LPEKKTITMVDSPKGMIEAVDLEYKTVREDPNVYELEDGTRLKVRLYINKISRGIDPDTKKTYILPNGEPLYNIRWALGISAEVPKETFERLKEE
jgi:hypothetical protein